MSAHRWYPGGGCDPYNSASTYIVHVVALLSREYFYERRLAQGITNLSRFFLKIKINALFGEFLKENKK